MKRWVLGAGVLILLAVLWWLWGTFSFLAHGATRTKALGGHWQVLYHEYAADGRSVTLERTRGGHPVEVEELIGLFRYMDDDCVLYSTHRGQNGPQCFAACGDLQPLQLTSASYDEWEILPDGLQKIEWVGQAKQPTVKIPWSEIKPKALAQPRSPLTAGTGKGG